MKSDLMATGIGIDHWFDMAQDRGEWRCERVDWLQKFRWIKMVKEAGRQRHKKREGERAIQSEEVRYECEVCEKIVKSSGGLLRHKKVHRK